MLFCCDINLWPVLNIQPSNPEGGIHQRLSDDGLPFRPAPATTVAGKPMSDHNFWTEWARKPPKVSLDP